MKTYVSEFIGTFLITLAVIGSGEMATQLTDDKGIQLLINCLSTVIALYITIRLFSSLSGAHFNPIVTLGVMFRGEMGGSEALRYIFSQGIGALAGAFLSNLIFELPIAISQTERNGINLLVAEVIASAGLLFIVFARWIASESRAVLIPLWIAAAYFFTSSTAFANPVITFGRIFSDSYAGINPGSALLFVLAQCMGGILGFTVCKRFESDSNVR